MVGPSISNDDRLRTTRLFKVGFTLLVGLSGALVAFQGDAGIEIIGIAFVVGLAIGGVLTWFVARNLRAIQPEGMRERQRRKR